MGLFQTITELEYPESDGRPMGETDLHRRRMMRIQNLLEHRYRGQRVYVACDLLAYYTEGMPHDYLVPDNFVVKDIEPGDRRTYKVWEEGQPPQVVFEVTSRGTRREDEVHKPGIYARIGVRELFLYDPTSDYLCPPLQGFRLDSGSPIRIEADAAGRIASDELGIALSLDGAKLVMTDKESGNVLQTAAEEAQAQLAAERASLIAERAARHAAEAKAAALEEELKRLRGQGEDEPK